MDPNGYTLTARWEVAVMREAVLTLLLKEPGHGRAIYRRLCEALGTGVPALNEGQVYITLSRLERAGLVRVRGSSSEDVSARKVYEATAAGHDLSREWLTDTSWQRVAPLDFHLKLVAAAATGTADPLGLIDAQRRELLRVLSEVQRAQAGQHVGSEGELLAQGTSLRLQADLHWLEACERWATRLNPQVTP